MKYLLLSDQNNEYGSGFTGDPMRAARGVCVGVLISAAAILLVVFAVRWLV